MPDHHLTRSVPADVPGRDQVIAGLRELAGYLEQHPGVPVSLRGWRLSVYYLHHDDRDGIAEVDRVAAILGTPVTDNTAAGGLYCASQQFGPVSYEIVGVSRQRLDTYRAALSYYGAVTPAQAA
jgi:hypothetical protein